MSINLYRSTEFVTCRLICHVPLAIGYSPQTAFPAPKPTHEPNRCELTPGTPKTAGETPIRGIATQQPATIGCVLWVAPFGIAKTVPVTGARKAFQVAQR
jgi:hypothetical protein